MLEWLTDRDRRNISEFAETPKYERSPEMLIPEDEE